MIMRHLAEMVVANFADEVYLDGTFAGCHRLVCALAARSNDGIAGKN